MTALARITAQHRDADRVRAEFESPSAIQRADLTYTCDTGKWQDRKWETMRAELDTNAPRVSAPLPAATTVWYLNLFRPVNGYEFLIPLSAAVDG